MVAVADVPLLAFQHCDPGLRFIAQDLTSCTHARNQQFTAVTQGKQRFISEKITTIILLCCPIFHIEGLVVHNFSLSVAKLLFRALDSKNCLTCWLMQLL
jgi:hypothetical protein